MRSTAFLAASAMLWVTVAAAQPAPVSDEMQAALELQRAMGGEAAVERGITAMRPVLIRNVMQISHEPMDRVVAEVDNVILPALKRHMPEIVEAKARIYAKYFSVRDLEVMTAFYRSETGQKLLANQVAIATDTMTAMQPLMRDMMAKAMQEKKALQAKQNSGGAPAP